MSASSTAPERALELTISRILEAPRELVFALWTDANHAAQWWGPQGFINVSCRLDARIGGGFRIAMRSPDGAVFTKCGSYREIAPPERLVFTYAWEQPDGSLGVEMLVTVTFEAVGARTLLTLHQTGFETALRRDGHRTGWTSCLERFAAYAERV